MSKYLFLQNLILLQILSSIEGSPFQFDFYSRNAPKCSYNVRNLHKILENPQFDRNKRTAIYNYGFLQETRQTDVRKVIDAYLENGDFNFIIVSYNSILDNTVFNANSHGKNIAEALLELFKRGYGDFHIIGFSLGGVIAGIIGRCVKNLSHGRYEIQRITGIDAGRLPPFFTSIKELNPNDARFVDTIHGESSLFGSSSAVGHANFLINNGQKFPECNAGNFLLDAVCSHLTTPMLFAESVRNKNPRLFIAQKYSNYEDYKYNQCTQQASPVGLYVDESSRGNYFLDISLKPKNTNH